MPIFVRSLLAFLWHVVIIQARRKYALKSCIFVRGAAARFILSTLRVFFVFRLYVWHLSFFVPRLCRCFLWHLSFLSFVCFPFCFLAFLLSCFLTYLLAFFSFLCFPFVRWFSCLVLSFLSLVTYCLSYLIAIINNKIYIYYFVCVCAYVRTRARTTKTRENKTHKKRERYF